MLIELRCPPSENLLLSVSVRGCQRSLGLASTLHVWQPLLARTVCKEKAQNQDEEDIKTHESERKLCIWVKLPRGSGGGGGSSSSTESTWEAFLGKLEVVNRLRLCALSGKLEVVTRWRK